MMQGNERKEPDGSAAVMTVVQALEEKRQLVNRIFEDTERARFTGRVKPLEEMTDQGRDAREAFEKNAREMYAKIREEIRTYQRLENALLDSNASTWIETSFGRFTVMSAIALKNRLDGGGFYGEELNFEENLCRKMRKEAEIQQKEVERSRRQQQRMAEQLLVKNWMEKGKRKKETWMEDPIQSQQIGDYLEATGERLLDPLGVTELAEELDKKREQLRTELAAQIQISNSQTWIHISKSEQEGAKEDVSAD